MPKVTQVNGRDDTTQPGVMTPSQQSVLLQEPSILSADGILLAPSPGSAPPPRGVRSLVAVVL